MTDGRSTRARPTTLDDVRDVERGLRALLLDETPRYLDGVPRRAQDVYRRLVRNTLLGNMKEAVPIARRIFGDDVIERFTARALVTRPPSTRLVRDVPGEIAATLKALDEQGVLDPPHPAFAELLHWEVAEIDVLLAPPAPPARAELTPDARVVVDPSTRLVAYRFDVHRMKPGDAMPDAPRARPALVVAWRREERMRFLEVDGVVARTLTLAASGLTVDAIARALDDERGAPGAPGALEHTLLEWRDRGAITGFAPPADEGGGPR